MFPQSIELNGPKVRNYYSAGMFACARSVRRFNLRRVCVGEYVQCVGLIWLNMRAGTDEREKTHRKKPFSSLKIGVELKLLSI